MTSSLDFNVALGKDTVVKFAELTCWKYGSIHLKADALLSDLSKAFECFDHNSLIAKLHAYGCQYNSLKLIYSYLQYRFHRVKVNSTYSSWADILNGIPQGSIRGPFIFANDLIDLFL